MSKRPKNTKNTTYHPLYFATDNGNPQTLDPTPPPQHPKRIRASVLDEPEPNTGRGLRSRPKAGTYARMNSGLDPLEANMAFAESFWTMLKVSHLISMTTKNGWYTSLPRIRVSSGVNG